MKIKLGITVKVFLLTVTLVVISSSLVSFLIYREINNLLIEKEMNTIRHDIELKSSNIRSNIKTLWKNVGFLSHTPPIQGIIRRKPTIY